MGMGFAPKYTHVPVSQTDSQIESGEPIYVWGIMVSNTTAGIVTIEEANTSTVIMRFDVNTADKIQVMDIPFMADKGLQVTTPASCVVTVFHSNAGG